MRQVRVLVASALRAAALEAGGGDDGGDDERLLAMATSGQQELTAFPAPALGLCFAGSGSEPWPESDSDPVSDTGEHGQKA